MTKPIKVLSVFGTRPEAIKMAPLVRTLNDDDAFESIVCVTAQHREMLDQVMDAFSITADYDLNIMKKAQSLMDITTGALLGLDKVLKECTPDIVLVHGDTSTTFAASLAAFYNKIPVGHVEAGLRTYDKYSPFPEEMNRVLTDAISDLYFAPTTQNRENLLKENIKDGIFITGNTVIDAIHTTAREEYTFACDALNHIDYSKKVILVTAHRRENWGEPMQKIMNALKKVALANPDAILVYPMHLNPVVREVAKGTLADVPNVMLIDPLDVLDMHNIMRRCFIVMTDSGGLQEEAPALGKPVLVLRRETERPEAVTAGTVKIVGCDEDVIFDSAMSLLTDENAYNKMAHAVNPYGDGKASVRIAEAIKYHFGVTDKAPDEFIPA